MAADEPFTAGQFMLQGLLKRMQRSEPALAGDPDALLLFMTPFIEKIAVLIAHTAAVGSAENQQPERSDQAETAALATQLMGVTKQPKAVLTRDALGRSRTTQPHWAAVHPPSLFTLHDEAHSDP